MPIKYTNILNSKALQNLIYPNWDFWFENKPSGNPDVHYVGNQRRCLSAKGENLHGVPEVAAGKKLNCNLK
jgi:hypothetical protein